MKISKVVPGGIPEGELLDSPPQRLVIHENTDGLLTPLIFLAPVAVGIVCKWHCILNVLDSTDMWQQDSDTGHSESK